jgi:SagB-type dehydrogenase family enzyme
MIASEPRATSLSSLQDDQENLRSEELSPALRLQLSKLSLIDQDLIASMIERFKLSVAPDEKLDVVGFIHQYLKADLEHTDASVFLELASLKAPPLLKDYPQAERFTLPTDFLPLPGALDTLIARRCSERNYGSEALDLRTLSTFLHYTYGIKRFIAAYNWKEFPVRMTPSSGGLQAGDLYVLVNQVEGLPKGLYYYHPHPHALLLLDRGNMRRHLSRCCIGNEFVAEAPVVFLLAANMPRIRWKYGERSYRCVHLDIGHLSQSMYLVATALDLNLCAVLGYLDDMVNNLMQLDGKNEFIVLTVGLGHKPYRDACALPREESHVSDDST